MGNMLHDKSMLSATDMKRLRELLAEEKRRRGEGLRLYRPRPDQVPFHMSKAGERLIRGGVRGGKTMPALAEIASAATGQSIIGADGKPMPMQYPTDRPLVIWIIGWDEDHIARLYRKLFRPGQFRIIEDKATGQWRAWQPWKPEDVGRKAETKPSPPMIPERLAPEDSFAWKSKKEQVFTSWTNPITGTTIHAYSSGAAPAQGEAVDVICIDEDVKIPASLAEWQSRLADNHGRLIWTAWPHFGNEALRMMSKRAAKDRNSPNPDVEEWVFKFSANPYIDDDDKRRLLKAWSAAGQAVLQSRDRGEFAEDMSRVWWMFDPDIHGIPRLSSKPDALDSFVANNNWRIPNEWTRYMVLDPGTNNPALLLAAVPPPELGDYVVCEAEFWGPRATATMIAQAAKDMIGSRIVQAFIIDAHAARQTPMGFSHTIYDGYRMAFEAADVKSVSTGYDFLFGSDDIAARNQLVTQWLELRPDGTTKFRYCRDQMPNLTDQMAEYQQAITREDVTEKTVERKKDLCACLGYLASMDPQYIPLPAAPRPLCAAYKQYLKDKQIAEGSGSGPVYVGWGLPSDLSRVA